MTMTDPIADMLTRIRNAHRASHEQVSMPFSKIKENIASVLKSEGYIRNYNIISQDNKKTIKIFIKYDNDGTSVINGIKRISKTSQRNYSSYKKIPKVLNGYGINIVSTSKGIMSDINARKGKIGGEILCSVW